MSSPYIWGPNSAINLHPSGGDLDQVNGRARMFDGSKNYISNSSFLNNTTLNWSLGTIGTLTNGLPTGSPTFGSGSSGNLSIATTSTTPLRAPFCLTYVSSAATTQGDMLSSSAITVDLEDQAKVLSWKFYYQAFSGSTNCNFSGTSSNSFGVAVYDVTNSTFLGTAGQFNIIQSSGVGICTGTFQTASTTASIRFIMYNVTATAGAATLYLDDFFVGPQTSANAPAMTDWVQYTPTFVGFGTPSAVTFYSRRVGDSLQVHGTLTTGTSTATSNSVSVGYNGGNANVSVDTTKIATNTKVGDAITGAASTTYFRNAILAPASSTTTVQISVQNSTTSATTSPVGGTTIAGTGVIINMDFMVPIVGWSSNTSSSADTDTRVVAMRSNNASATVTSSYSTVTWNTIVNDTHGAMGSTTYTIPVTGYYDVTSQVSLGGTQALNGTAAISVNKNGTLVQENDTGYAGALTATNTISIGLDAVLCNAGDTILIQVKSSATLPVIADATNGCFFSVVRRSGPAVVQASESVNMSYTNTAGSTVGTSPTVIPFATKVFDSHNAFVTDTYTCPISGKYRVSTMMTTAGVTLSTSQDFRGFVYQNGSVNATSLVLGTGGAGTSHSIILSTTLSCKAGDTIQIQAQSAVSTTLITSVSWNSLSIERVGN